MVFLTKSYVAKTFVPLETYILGECIWVSRNSLIKVLYSKSKLCKCYHICIINIDDTNPDSFYFSIFLDNTIEIGVSDDHSIPFLLRSLNVAKLGTTLYTVVDYQPNSRNCGQFHVCTRKKNKFYISDTKDFSFLSI